MKQSLTFLLAASFVGAGCMPEAQENNDSDALSASFMAETGKSDDALGAYDLWSVVLASNTLTYDELNRVVGLDARAAHSIIEYRAGLDGAVNTPDDQFITSARILDDLYYVGPTAYQKLQDYAKKRRWNTPDGMREVFGQLLDHAGGAEGRAHFLLPDEYDLAAIPQDAANPLTPAKVELGKLLFHDRALAQNPKVAGNENTYSCASCHHAAGGFGSGDAGANGGDIGLN